MKQIIFVLLLNTLTLACSQKKDIKWSAKDQKDFTESCIENAKSGIGEENAIKYCDCMMEKMMKKYPDINDAEKISMGETMELANECARNNMAADSLNKQVDASQKRSDGKDLRLTDSLKK